MRLVSYTTNFCCSTGLSFQCVLEPVHRGVISRNTFVNDQYLIISYLYLIISHNSPEGPQGYYLIYICNIYLSIKWLNHPFEKYARQISKKQKSEGNHLVIWCLWCRVQFVGGVLPECHHCWWLNFGLRLMKASHVGSSCLDVLQSLDLWLINPFPPNVHPSEIRD